eukprot:tig00000403_g339.t1
MPANPLSRWLPASVVALERDAAALPPCSRSQQRAHELILELYRLAGFLPCLNPPPPLEPAAPSEREHWLSDEVERLRAELVEASSDPIQLDEEALRALPAAEVDALLARLHAASKLVACVAREARRRDSGAFASPPASPIPSVFSSPAPATPPTDSASAAAVSFECPVCLESLPRDRRRVLLGSPDACGHVVCEACGRRLLQARPPLCPVARCEIYAMSPIYD